MKTSQTLSIEQHNLAAKAKPRARLEMRERWVADTTETGNEITQLLATGDKAKLPQIYAALAKLEVMKSKALTEHFDFRQMDWQAAEDNKNYLSENAPAISDAFDVLLSEKMATRETVLDSVGRWLAEIARKIAGPSTTPEMRDELQVARDEKEAILAAAEYRAAEARRAIERFRTNPTPEHYGAACGAMAVVSFPNQ